MAFTYRWTLQVRTYETDRYGLVQDSFYLNYLQESATLASSAAGYNMEWYMKHRRLWLIRTLTIRYGTPARLGDELEIATWVSDFKRVQSHRDYDMRRVSDKAQILRARANWVYVDQETMLPTRLPEEFLTNFDPHHDPQENLDLAIPNLQSVNQAHAFVDKQVAQPYEIDRAQHVNNGVYPRWIEGATAHALNGIGWGGIQIEPAWRKIEYLRSAQEGDRVQIVSQLTGYNDQHLMWSHTIQNAESGEALVQDTMVCRTSSPMSPELPSALITGQSSLHR